MSGGRAAELQGRWMALAFEESAEDEDSQAANAEDLDRAPGFRPGARPARDVTRRHLKQATRELAAAHEALRANPGDAQAAVRAARLHGDLGEVSKAMAVLDACLARGEPPRSLSRDGGQLFLALGAFRKARRWLKRAVADARTEDPELLAALRQATEGLAADARLGLTPGDRRLYLGAMERLIRARPGPAIELLETLTVTHPGFAPGWLALRGGLEALGRTGEVQALGERWLAAAPDLAAGIGAAMGFRLSPRGLTFDPLEPVTIRGLGESLQEVATPAALHSGGDRILHLDPGGGALELEPVIPLASVGPQKTRFSYEFAPKFVVALEGAALVGRGLVLNRNGEMPAEAWPPCHMGKAGFRRAREGFIGDPAAFANGIYPLRVFDTPALLMAAPTDASFGDWVQTVPPRLALAEAAGLDCPLVLRDGVPASFVEMLGSLGWDTKRIVYHDATGVSLFPRLYTTSWPLPARPQPMRDLFGIYRRFPGRRAPGPGGRLYLSREGVDGRKLVNEAEIRAIFERRGFRVVQPETLGFQEAKDLFASADLIGGPYGSAYLNVVYAPTPPSALVIMPPYAPGFLDEVAFWIGANGGRLAYLTGEAAPDAPEGGRWTASAAQVEAALDEFLAAAAPA